MIDLIQVYRGWSIYVIHYTYIKLAYFTIKFVEGNIYSHEDLEAIKRYVDRKENGK